MDGIKNTPGWGIPDDFNDILNNSRYKNRTTLDEMRDVMDDLADDMSQAVPESPWTELLIYLIESLERKAKDREEFNSLLYGLVEYWDYMCLYMSITRIIIPLNEEKEEAYGRKTVKC